MADTEKPAALVAQDQIRGQTVLGQHAPLLQAVPQGKVSVVAPDGEVGLLDAAQFAEASEKGYRQASQEELRHQQVKELYGDTVGQLTTAGANLVDTAAFGFGKGIMYKGAEILGGPGAAQQFKDNWENYDAANPTAKVVGQGLGFVVPAIATGGGSLLGEGLATAAGEGIASMVGKGALSTATKYAVGGGLDAALYGAGTAFSDAELGDPSNIAEKMMASAGKNFLFGAALGGGLGLVGGAIGKATEGIATKLPSTQEMAQDLMRYAVGVGEKDAMRLENMGVDAHRHVSFMMEHPEIQAWAQAAKPVDELVPILKKTIETERGKIADEVALIVKDPEVGPMFDRLSAAVKEVESLPFHQNIARKMQNELEDFGLKTGYYQHEQFIPEAFRRESFAAKPFAREAFVEPPLSNAHIREMMPFQSGEEARFFKKEAEAIAKEDAQIASRRSTHESRQAMFEATHNERQAAALAKHDARQAEAEAEHMAKQAKLAKAAPKIIRDEITGKPIPGAGKVSFAQLEKFRDKFEDLLYSESKADAAGKFAQELRNAHKVIEEELVKQAGPKYQAAVESKRIATMTHDIADSSAKAKPGFGWGSAGAAMGLGFMGPKGLAFGLASKLVRERGPQFVAAMLWKGQQRAAIKGTVLKVAKNMADASRLMVKGGIRASSVALSRDKEYDRTSKQITDLAISPERVQALTKGHVPGDVAPEIQRMYIDRNIQAIQYLQSIMPRGSQLIPVLPGLATTPPPRAAKANWMKAVDVFYDPISTISAAVRKNQLSKEHVNALDSMYPTLAQEFRTQALSALGEAVKGKKMPSYHKRMQLGLLLRAETDATLNPTFIVAQQAMTETLPENDPYTGLDASEGGGKIGPKQQGRRTDIENDSGETAMDNEDT